MLLLLVPPLLSVSAVHNDNNNNYTASHAMNLIVLIPVQHLNPLGHLIGLCDSRLIRLYSFGHWSRPLSLCRDRGIP